MRRNRKGLLMGMVFLLIGYLAYAQGGFMKRYDFGSEAKFHNVLLREDTLILIGTSYDPAANPPQWGTLFVKVDTMGNVLQHKLHVDDQGGQIVLKTLYPVIQTSVGHYLLGGFLVESGNVFLQELDKNGDTVNFWEYELPDGSLTNFPRHLIEMDSGWLLFSDMQLPVSGNDNILITKIDPSGEIEWSVTYGEEDYSQAPGGVYLQDENTIVIGAVRGKIATPYHPVSDWTQSWIFAIDSMGEMKWEWYSEENEHGYVRDIQQDEQGNWVYVTHQFGVFGPYEAGHQAMIVKRDPELNLIWEAPVGESWWFENVVYDLHPTMEGGWQAVGRIIQPEPFYGWAGQGVQSWTSGAQVQLNAEGSINWIRRDTMVIQGDVSQSEFAGLVVLPSGSSIAVGSYKESGAGWRGWVVKTDRNGCVREDCFTGVEEVQKENDGLQVFPNPATEILKVQWNDPSTSLVRLEFYAGDGRQVFNVDELNSRSATINISTWVPGIYFYRLWTKDGELHAGKVVVR